MGKQMSKAGGMRGSTRRRSQIISEPNVVAAPEPPRLVPETTDRAILTLKLQRDELTVYKGRVTALLRKEDDTIKKLLKEGKDERAKLLLKKKRFQEHILQETEQKLNSILNQANLQATLTGIRKDVDEAISQNGEAMKRLHILLSLENAEWMLNETYEGSKKQTEVDRLLQLATLGEREILEKDVDSEMQKLALALGIVPPAAATDADVVDASPEESPEEVQKEDQKEIVESVRIEDAPNETENELEALAIQKMKEREEPEMHISDQVSDASHSDDAAIGQQQEEDVPDSPDQVVHETVLESSDPAAAVAGVIDEVVSNTTSAVSDSTTAADADDEKSSSSETPSEVPLNTGISNLLPDVPTHAIDGNNDEVPKQLPEVIALADAENV